MTTYDTMLNDGRALRLGYYDGGWECLVEEQPGANSWQTLLWIEDWPSTAWMSSAFEALRASLNAGEDPAQVFWDGNGWTVLED